jgi:hypothetical protein
LNAAILTTAAAPIFLALRVQPENATLPHTPAKMQDIVHVHRAGSYCLKAVCRASTITALVRAQNQKHIAFAYQINLSQKAIIIFQKLYIVVKYKEA